MGLSWEREWSCGLFLSWKVMLWRDTWSQLCRAVDHGMSWWQADAGVQAKLKGSGMACLTGCLQQGRGAGRAFLGETKSCMGTALFWMLLLWRDTWPGLYKAMWAMTSSGVRLMQVSRPS